MFPAEFICCRAFILSSVAFLRCVGGTSTEAKPQRPPLLEVLSISRARRRMLVRRALTNISYPCFFTLSRAEGSIQSSEEHGKTGERRDGTASSWFLCVGIGEVSLPPAWARARGGGVMVGVQGRAPFAPSRSWLPAKRGERQGQKPLISLRGSGWAEARWCKPSPFCCAEQQGSGGEGGGGKSSISCCPHCSCFSSDFILLIYDRCRWTEKPLFHPSRCSRCTVTRVCPRHSPQLRPRDALPPAGAALASLHHQVSALSSYVRRKTANLGDLFPSVLLREPAWSPIPGRKAPLSSPQLSVTGTLESSSLHSRARRNI